MKIAIQKKILISILIILIILLNTEVFASTSFKKIDYSEEYKQWLQLSDEEKEKRIQPRMYDLPKETYAYKNPLKKARMLRSSLESKFTLVDYIPENIVIKNQGTTGECWAFASVAALETNLALKDYYNGREVKEYDFSERHMDYATCRNFLNDQINEKGFNRAPGDGGSSIIATRYLTNGMGAIDESDMPFIDSEKLIEISEIQGKTVTSQLFDTIDFPSYKSTEDTTQLKIQMKEHIKNYGGIVADVHGAQLDSGYYNNSTGAIYCDNEEDCPVDHEVLIIGWDDNYSRENFLEIHRPQNNGAWIIKNSWGAKLEFKLSEILSQYKQQIFEKYREHCIEQGWTDATQIPDDEAINTLRKNGYIVEGDNITYIIGDNGIMYISYEDINIYSQLSGIINSANSVNYKNIYQYDEYGYTYAVQSDESKVYVANVFEKKTQGPEFLTQLLTYAMEPCTCKVFVNVDGISKNKNDLKEVKLKAGDSETFGIGYHTLEFAKPVEITSNNFVVVLEIQGQDSDSLILPLEKKIENSIFDVVKTENQRCFVATATEFNSNIWTDASILNGDTIMKVYTVSEDDSIKSLEVTTPPNKTVYIEGQDFDTTGMVVTATFKDGSKQNVNDYVVENGKNLKVTQTSVTISYGGKSVNQQITVQDNNIVLIKIQKAPNRVNYVVGQNFDTTGMIVVAKYENGMEQQIDGYTIQDGKNLQLNQTTVTIEYEGFSVTQEITVEEKELSNIKISKMPTKMTYIQNKENLDLTGGLIKLTYNDGSIEELLMDSEQVEVTGFNNKILGTNTITLKYEGKKITFNVTIVEEQIIEEPENSSLQNAKSDVKLVKAYYYTDNAKQEYTTMDIEITNIQRDKENDSYEYYYYLSPNQEESNIKDWIKVTNNQTAKDKITFTINTKDISNYEEVSTSDVLYLYIKEVAIKSEQQAIYITKSMELELDVEIEEYLDDVRIQNVNIGGNVGNNLTGGNNQTVDNTVAGGIIPQTGQATVMMSAILIISVLGIIGYIRYKNIDK